MDDLAMRVMVAGLVLTILGIVMAKVADALEEGFTEGALGLCGMLLVIVGVLASAGTGVWVLVTGVWPT